MKHRIDPKVDCVFKALLGSEENRPLLIHFLNAILSAELSGPIVDVEILNPYNDKEFLTDKLSIVDVKAKDKSGRIFQVEIQMCAYPSLPKRMVYNWADIYTQQLQTGGDYTLLKPVYGIWLLAENLFDDKEYSRNFKLRDSKCQVPVEHGGIWVLELAKFHAQRIENEQQRWLLFFRDGETLNDDSLPDWMNTAEMRKAMGTLRQFSEKERDYHAYQARQNFLREQSCIQKERLAALQREEAALQALEQERQEKQAALQREEAAVRREVAAAQEKEAALQEIERLKALLEKKEG
ncbi:MAG: Rpn family recombination-promoting nuclease/putative transposase [Pseudomonadota bacterium]